MHLWHATQRHSLTVLYRSHRIYRYCSVISSWEILGRTIQRDLCVEHHEFMVTCKYILHIFLN